MASTRETDADRLARVLSRIEFGSGESQCWFWLGPKIKGGYGRASIGGRKWLIHRWLYELLAGAIPVECELDHLCRNTSCVHPLHVEPVTHHENVRRGRTASVQRALKLAKTECLRGHAYTDENTYIDGKGKRSCRQCRAAVTRRRRPSERVAA